MTDAALDTGLAAVEEALEAARRSEPDRVLGHLRVAADRLSELIDETMAEAVLEEGTTLRGVGAQAGLSENAVGPRLARTSRLGGYADERGRVTAAGVQRARYDLEAGVVRSAPSRPPLRFKPRRPTA